MTPTWIVTGGAGFIGSNFVRHALRSADARIVVVDKLTYAGHRENLDDVARDPRFDFVEADIADRAAMQALFAARRPAAVVNLAAETHVDRSIEDPSAFLHTNLIGTYTLLECSRRALADAAPAERAAFRFLHVSTDEVYGSLGPTGRFREDSPYEPNSPYSASKAGADHLVRAWFSTYGLPALVTNCSNNYGPYQFPEKLIPLMLLNALEGRPLPIYGDGSNVRDWLNVEDHCAGLLAALQRGRPGEKYNLGGGAERSNLDLVETLCARLEELRPAAHQPRLRERGLGSYRELIRFVPDRPGHDRRYAIDAGKAERELGWRPAHTLESGLAATLRWYLEHEAWCRAVQQRGAYDRARLGLGAASSPI